MPFVSLCVMDVRPTVQSEAYSSLLLLPPPSPSCSHTSACEILSCLNPSGVLLVGYQGFFGFVLFCFVLFNGYKPRKRNWTTKPPPSSAQRSSQVQDRRCFALYHRQNQSPVLLPDSCYCLSCNQAIIIKFSHLYFTWLPQRFESPRK